MTTHQLGDETVAQAASTAGKIVCHFAKLEGFDDVRAEMCCRAMVAAVVQASFQNFSLTDLKVAYSGMLISLCDFDEEMVQAAGRAMDALDELVVRGEEAVAESALRAYVPVSLVFSVAPEDGS